MQGVIMLLSEVCLAECFEQHNLLSCIQAIVSQNIWKKIVPIQKYIFFLVWFFQALQYIISSKSSETVSGVISNLEMTKVYGRIVWVLPKHSDIL